MGTVAEPVKVTGTEPPMLPEAIVSVVGAEVLYILTVPWLVKYAPAGLIIPEPAVAPDALSVKDELAPVAVIPANVVEPAKLPAVAVVLNPVSETFKLPIPVLTVTPFAGVAVLGLRVWACGGRLAAVSVTLPELVIKPPV